MALESYDVLDSSPEEAFDCLTRLACRQFNTPVALVSLVDQSRQWFKSVQGLDVRETDRESAFCGYAILSDEPLVVLNTTNDQRFAANALVCDQPGIRFYAGVPLVTHTGFRLGTFCVIDFTARDAFSVEDVSALKDFARSAMQVLELRRQAKIKNDQDIEGRIAEDARIDLFSTVAHEIRSPIAALNSSANILQSQIFGPVGDERYLEFFSVMAETAEQVMTLTDRMLDFARLKTGDIEISDEPLSVVEILSKAKRSTVQITGQDDRNIEIVPPQKDIVLTADSAYVSQMLHNLMANAIKYSNGDPRIELSAETSETGVLAISVADNGIGMSSEGLALALQPYKQLKQSGRNAAGGVGIGLPLVKRLIELHGGQLAVDSTEGRGTKVSLIFPAYRVEMAKRHENFAV
ncbi:GAF domain-containing sensor histidine kinase [Pelagibius sp. Alg239-R121]|uniref:GAF domain-containing sensor histidine kinase n=1 Tax=Pelagibius sp. Alg239-R121 TaxID=2993448 RepID=UPI0024A6BABE|nr:GAF domain-containing sensor histidine kinase [Pelagibius sp. Alg239-R121]